MRRAKRSSRAWYRLTNCSKAKILPCWTWVTSFSSVVSCMIRLNYSTIHEMKSGIVALIGRPNVGKSTLVNAILRQKVSITSPKPQTTRFSIQAVFEDERGQIIFIDTPGIFGKVEDQLAARINKRAEESLGQNIDVVLYMIDHTRARAEEENKTLGIVRRATVPKILVINKIDIKQPTHIIQYKFMEEEFDDVVRISALTGAHIPTLLNTIFSHLPERKSMIDATTLIQPALNLDSKLFISELIREKAFLFLRSELQYTLTTVVDEIAERENGLLFIKARILTSADRYKAMIIGKNGAMIKEISMAARKELETATSKKVFIELTVETDPHWIQYV